MPYRVFLACDQGWTFVYTSGTIPDLCSIQDLNPRITRMVVQMVPHTIAYTDLCAQFGGSPLGIPLLAADPLRVYLPAWTAVMDLAEMLARLQRSLGRAVEPLLVTQVPREVLADDWRAIAPQSP